MSSFHNDADRDKVGPISDESINSDGELCPSCRLRLRASWHVRAKRYIKSRLSTRAVGRRKALRNRFILVITTTTLFIGGIIALVWFSFVLALIRRLSPQIPNNGLQHIINEWEQPSDSAGLISKFAREFSNGITPVACHSHNDYWRRVPLFDALAAGCTGVEADVWLHNYDNGTSDLYVGHSSGSLKPDRTLRSLYVDPLVQILSYRDQSVPSGQDHRTTGLFDTDPNITLTLLIDFKTDGKDLWPVVAEQISPLNSWLTNWNGTSKTLTPGAITVVGTGNAPFDMVQHDSSYRSIFFDAPLDELPENNSYTPENSYYASVSMKSAIGLVFPTGLRDSQKEKIKHLIDTATARGLKARFWNTPSWPISLRNGIWKFLTDANVGMLNVDDLVEATRWDWNWCNIAGLVLCGW